MQVFGVEVVKECLDCGAAWVNQVLVIAGEDKHCKHEHVE